MKHLLLVDNLGSSQLGDVILNSNPNNKTFELNNIELSQETLISMLAIRSQCNTKLLNLYRQQFWRKESMTQK